MKISSVLVLTLLVLVADGCVHNRKEESSDPQVYVETMSAAPMNLVKSAEDYFAKGRLTMAHSQAERAYRLEPRNYQVLFLLARIAKENKSPDDAEQWAYKALESLQGQYTSEKKKVWEFIASCRREQGDVAAAELALVEARKYSRE